eukprot:3671824-Pyramimonas_sp.AAC.1
MAAWPMAAGACGGPRRTGCLPPPPLVDQGVSPGADPKQPMAAGLCLQHAAEATTVSFAHRT